MRSDRRFVFAMTGFVVLCFSVPVFVPSRQPVAAPIVKASSNGAETPSVTEEVKPVAAESAVETVRSVEPTPEPAKPGAPAVVVAPPKPRGEPKDNYYVLLVASDAASNLARDAHTFATFMRCKSDGENESFDTHTISWLPQSLVIAPLRGAEPGKNFSLEETFNWAKNLNSRFTAWGPYEIKKELYDRSKQQHERLEKREVMYKMLDVRFRPDVAINCIHAVCDCAPGNVLLTGSAFGEEATWMVADWFRPWMINVGQTHDGLVQRLGLQSANINFRKLEPVAEAPAP